MKKTIAAVAAALTLAGCSSSGGAGGAPAPGGSSASKAACSLLTDEQVGKVIDKAPTKHNEDQTIPAIKNCKWETGDDLASLSIAYGKASDYPIADANTGKWEKLSGIGDKAGYLLGVMVVSAGGYNFQIMGGPNNLELSKDARNEQQKAKLTEAAGYALQALGVGGPVKEAPKATAATKTAEKPDTTKTKPSDTPETSDKADPDTDTKTSEPDESTSETPEN